MPKVSIMIPTYNQSNYIEQCIESALSQDYDNLEIIISDDSTDNLTENIIRDKYINDSRIQYYHNAPSLGRVQNYHHTLYNKCTGVYVMNLDGDDFLINDGFISYAVSLFEKTNNLVAVFANEKIYHEKENKFTDRLKNSSEFLIIDGKDVYLNRVKMRLNFYHLSSLYRRESALESGFYTEDILGADTVSLMKLLVMGKVAFVPEYAGAWRVHDRNDSFIKDIDIMIENIKTPNILYEYAASHNLSDANTLRLWKDSSTYAYFERYFFNLISNKEYKLAYQLKESYKNNFPDFYLKTFLRIKFYAKFLLALVGKYK